MKRVLPFLLLLLGIFAGFSQSTAQVPGLPNRWNNVSMADIDTGLVGTASFTIGGKTYLIGGDTSEYFGAHTRRTRQVWVYTHATNSWSKTTPFPGDLRMGAIAFGATSTGKGYYGLGYDTVGYADTNYFNKFYDAGGMPHYAGQVPFWHTRFLKDFWEFDTATVTWKRLKNFPILDLAASDTLPQPLMENGIANASAFSIDTIVKINGSTSKNFAGGFIFGEYFAFGGGGSVGQKFIDKPYFYDAALDSFFEGTNIPGPGRSNGVAMILDGKQEVSGRNPKLYAGLGDNDAYNIQLLDIYLKDWYSYDFETNVWKKERDLPDTGKSNAGSFAYEHIGFVTCGYDAEWKKNFFLYNTEDDDWTRYPDYRDSGRSLGAGFIHGNRGFYGAGFRGNSKELATFSWYNIDTSTIRIFPHFNQGDIFCAGDSISFEWYSVIPFKPDGKMVVQISDKDGIFEWPITSLSNMDTFDIDGPGDTIKAKLPHKLYSGSEYKIRIISTNPFYISRFTPTITVRENPKFIYYPKTHPVLDTVCIHSDFFIPSQVTGDTLTGVGFTYQWLRNGQPINFQTKDTLRLNAIGYADSGFYSLVATGSCYADTSVAFHILVDSVPPPKYIDPLDYPGMTGKVLTLCEYDTTTFYIEATGKKLSYQWYHNDKPLIARDNLEGLGSPVVKSSAWNLQDSGLYYLRIVESCGTYAQSDSIIVKMNAIPRIVGDPKNIFPAVLEGSTVNFEVEATGYDLNYHWRKDAALISNGPRITGANDTLLTITGLIPSDVAFYSCMVYGGCPGFGDTSNLAIIDLNASPSITKQPGDTLSVCEGASNVITIIAAGTNLQYNWRYEAGATLTGPTFSGVNTRILTITNAQVGDAGYIECVVDNSAGAQVISKRIYLRVKPKPAKPTLTQITNIMQSDITCDTYIWFYNGVWKGQYTTKNIKPSEEGDYTLRVICEGCPSELSDPKYFKTTSLVSAQANQLDMYPNPAQGKVMLELPGIHVGNPATVSVYDLSGKLIKTINKVDSDSYEVDLQHLSKGMYLVHVSSAEVNFSGKLVKD